MEPKINDGFGSYNNVIEVVPKIWTISKESPSENDI